MLELEVLSAFGSIGSPGCNIKLATFHIVIQTALLISHKRIFRFIELLPWIFRRFILRFHCFQYLCYFLDEKYNLFFILQVYAMLLLVCRGNIEQYFLSPGTMLYCNIVLLEDICLVRLLWQSLISVLTDYLLSSSGSCLFSVFRIWYLQEGNYNFCLSSSNM